MDFLSNDPGNFANLYARVTHMLLGLSGEAYRGELRKLIDASRDYRETIRQAYREQENVNLSIDMTEPEEIIMFEMVRWLSDQHYSFETNLLLEAMPSILLSMNLSNIYNPEFEDAAARLHWAVKKFSGDPQGLTYGDILKASPPALKPPPEFLPRFTKDGPDIPQYDLGKRPNDSGPPLKKSEAA